MKMIGTPEDIVKTFPCKGLVKIINTGFNFYVYSNVNKWVSFHYNKNDRQNTAVLGSKTCAFNSGEEKDALLKLLPLLAETKEVQKKTVKNIKQHKGTQACIAHVLKKADKIKAREDFCAADNRAITVLLSLADELKQFL